MMTILLVLEIYEKSRSFKSIQTCFLEQFQILLGGPLSLAIFFTFREWVDGVQTLMENSIFLTNPILRTKSK